MNTNVYEMGKSLNNLLMLPYQFCVRVLPSCIFKCILSTVISILTDK